MFHVMVSLWHNLLINEFHSALQSAHTTTLEDPSEAEKVSWESLEL